MNLHDAVTRAFGAGQASVTAAAFRRLQSDLAWALIEAELKERVDGLNLRLQQPSLLNEVELREVVVELKVLRSMLALPALLLKRAETRETKP